MLELIVTSDILNTMADKILNKEQLAAVRHGKGPLLIIAGAGTGKTTVITQRLNYLITEKKIPPTSVLALTFTEKAAYEMQERVDVLLPYGYTNLWIQTFHSFCDRILRDEVHNIGLDPNYKLISEGESVLLLRQNIFNLGLKIFRPLGNPTKFLDGLLTHFSRLADEDITPDEYLKYSRKFEIRNSKFEITPEEIAQTKELANAYQKYEELKVKNSLMDFADLISNTLRLFRERKNILKRYQDQFKFILVDEFQDTNYAQNELAILLAGDDKNITVVADDDQCLPADAQISVPNGQIPIKRIKVGDGVITAVGKGLLSISKVKNISKTRKKTRFIKLKTASGIEIETTQNHKMFCMIPGRKYGTNKNFYVYLMQRNSLGWRLGITDDIPQRLKLERSADKIIAIKRCSSLEEALFFETIFSLRYQIPKYPFKPRRGMKISGDWLRKLYSEFDTEGNAQKLALDLGIDLNSHHYSLGGVVRGSKERIKILINMCTRNYKNKNAKNRLLKSPKVLHSVTLETSSLRIKEILRKGELTLLPTKKGWKIRKYFSKLEEAGKFAKELEELTGGILEAKFSLGKRSKYTRSALVMPSKNILVGMYIPVKHGYEVIYEEVVKRTEETRIEFVYDIEIENTHNFIANDVIVHNSIYRFRGAAVSNVLQFKNNFPRAAIVTLTKNYRSTQEILDAAYKLIQNNNPNRLEVLEKIDKKLKSTSLSPDRKIELIHMERSEDEADEIAKKIIELGKKYEYRDIAILVRANNHSQLITTALQRYRIPYQFLGPGYLFQQDEVKDLIAYLTFLTNLMDSVSLFRVLSMDIFKIPYVELNYLLNFAKKKNVSLFEALYMLNQSFLKPPTIEKLENFRKMAEKHLEKSKKEQAGQILYDFLIDSGLYETLNKTDSLKDEKRVLNIAKFFDRVKTFEMERSDANIFTLTEWLTLMMQMGDSPTASDVDIRDRNGVNILTVHSSKGLEFKVVFLVNLVTDRFPSRERGEKIPIPAEIIKETLPQTADFHLEEERRLFYVGMTRAKERLYFTGADYYAAGKRPKKLSPFIYEALPQLRKQETKTNAAQLSLTQVLSSYEKREKEEEEKPHFKVSYITYSNLQMFDICPLHYKAKVIFNIPSPPTAVQSFGISLHRTLQIFYRNIQEGKKPTKSDLLKILKDEWDSSGYENKKHEEERFAQAVGILEKYYESEYNPEVVPLKLEYPFNFTLKNGVKVFGKIDRIDPKNGGVEIIDYKTGEDNPKASEAHELQLAIYALAATRVKDNILNRKPENITLTLHFLDGNTKKSMSFKKEGLEKLEEELTQKIEEIEGSDFKCSGSVLCLNCEYKILCQGPSGS